MKYIVKVRVLEGNPPLRKRVESKNKKEALMEVCKDYGCDQEDVDMIREVGILGYLKWTIRNSSKHPFKPQKS